MAASHLTDILVDRIIGDIIAREGGFVDHPADRGGPTKFGITRQTLAAHRGRDVSIEDVRNITMDEAREIYAARYIRGPRFDQIGHPALMALVVDCGVLHGTRRATRWLQAAAGVKDDGVVGPLTLRAVNGGDGPALYRRVLASRCRFIGTLVTRQPSQAAFAAGWANRVARFIEDTP